MQALKHHNQPDATMNSIEISRARRVSLGELVRQWGPFVVTAVVVPGGILIALVMLWRHWNQRRLALQSPARA